MNGRKAIGVRLPMVSAWALKIFTAITLLVGNIGCAIEAGIVRWGGFDTYDQVAKALETDSTLNILTGVSVICKLIGEFSVPVFVFLMVLGFIKTSNFKKYFISMLITAVISEIPYDLVMTGKWFEGNVQNPMFAMVIALAMIYFFKKYIEKDNSYKMWVKILCMVVGTGCGICWCKVLDVDMGVLIIILAAIFYVFREKYGYMMIVGIIATIICAFGGIGTYLAALSFYGIYGYNEKERTLKCSKYVFYAQYPAELIILAIIMAILI